MNNSNQLQAFDTNALKKRLAETIQGTFGMLIPQEQFEALVEQYIKEFFEREEFFDVIEVTMNPHGYARGEDKLKLRKAITPFQAQVWEHCASISRKALGEYFAKESNALQENMLNMFATNTEFSGTVSNNVAAIASKIQDAQMRAMICQATRILSRVFSTKLEDYSLIEDVEIQVKQTLGL